VAWRVPDSRWFDEAEWEAAPTCSMPAALPRPGNFPKSVKLVQHLHLRRTCLSEYLPWKTDPCPSIMSSTTMNPGFLTSSDELQLDEKLHPALKKLIIEKYSTSLAPASIKLIKAGAADKVQPHADDKLRVALVDLSGNGKICAPRLAGWGSPVMGQAASIGKIAILYAAFQLLYDLRAMAGLNVKTIRTKDDLVKYTTEVAWKALTCRPHLSCLFTFDDTVSPIKVEMNEKLNDYLNRMVDGSCSGVSPQLASELIMCIGFEYIASLLWQSGLYHPKRRGLWLNNTYCLDQPEKVDLDPRCHQLLSYPTGSYVCKYVKWTNNPLGNLAGIYITALSAATFFTLLAQERLVNVRSSREMEAMLKKGCWASAGGVPETARRAAKCGHADDALNDAMLIDSGTRRYVLAFVTKGATDFYGGSFLREIDQLVQNNP